MVSKEDGHFLDVLSFTCEEFESLCWVIAEQKKGWNEGLMDLLIEGAILSLDNQLVEEMQLRDSLSSLRKKNKKRV
jgi:hypothetical protein